MLCGFIVVGVMLCECHDVWVSCCMNDMLYECHVLWVSCCVRVMFVGVMLHE